VFIGQDMDQEKIIYELEACIATEEEVLTEQWKKGYNDEWPVQRAYAMQ